MTGLLDQFNRRHEYLRIAVNERCNLRCMYCMPREGIFLTPASELLSSDEIVQLATLFVEMGVRKIRVTGGEPLVRKDIIELCSRLSSIPHLDTLALTTNGTLLEDHAGSLRQAGVSQVNISLDSLRPERFLSITLRSDLERVLAGVDRALSAGFDTVKINTVVMDSVNDDEILDFVNFAIGKSLAVRFIEYMPFAGNGWHRSGCVAAADIRSRIEKEFVLLPLNPPEIAHGPAKEYSVEGTGAVLGFISTMTDHSCGSCNRLRLTADGKIRNCLFAVDEYDLKRLLRNNASMDVLEATVRTCVLLKWQARPASEDLLRLQTRPMIAIGG